MSCKAVHPGFEIQWRHHAGDAQLTNLIRTVRESQQPPAVSPPLNTMKRSATPATRRGLDRTLHQAVQLHQQGRLDRAEKLYRGILRASPSHFDALHLLGVLKQQINRSDEALILIETALRLDTTAPALSNFGSVLTSLRRPREAIPFLDRALALAPDFADAHSNKCRALIDLMMHDLALECAENALRVAPGHVDALLNKGLALIALKRPAEALATTDIALRQAPNNPKVLSNRGIALMELNRFEDAAESFRSALDIDPNAVEVLNNLANVYQQTGSAELSVSIYDRGLKLAPAHPNLNFNSALAHLTLGNFTQGWQRYEWRWRNPLFRSKRRDFKQPLWLGNEPLNGRTILLHAEQGLGDTLQFVRYVPLVAERGAKVLLEIPRPLKPLLSAMPGVSAVMDESDEKPPFDLQCPLMSLPLAFGTEIGTIPARTPYLEAPRNKIAEWQARISGDGLRVGLVWSGGLHHRHDHNRSIAFASLEPVLTVRGVRFFSLQRDVRDADRGPLFDCAEVRHLGDDFPDFADTAAAVSLLDLVITVDTAVAHLAGALAKPTWLLTPFWPDFRWLLTRTDSPWYPAMTLFRQPAIGDWTSAIKNVARALGSLAEQR